MACPIPLPAPVMSAIRSPAAMVGLFNLEVGNPGVYNSEAATDREDGGIPMSDSFFGIVHLPTYIIGTVLVILLPGPNSLFVLSTAARRGVRSGYRAACGVFIGDTMLMTLASIGIASVLKANPTVFLILKSAGGAYLGYLGINMIITAWKGRGAVRRRRRQRRP